MSTEISFPGSGAGSSPPGGPAGANSRAAHGDFLRAMRQHWKIILTGGLLAAGVSYYVTRSDVPMFTSEVLLRKTDSSPLAAAGLGTDRGVFMDDFGSQVEIIRSRRVLNAVVDSLGLALELVDFPMQSSRIIEDIDVDRGADRRRYMIAHEKGTLVLQNVEGRSIDTLSSEGWLAGPGFRFRVRTGANIRARPIMLVIRPPDQALESLRRRLQVEPGKGPDLIRVSYRDADPIRSAAVVNMVAHTYQMLRARSSSESASTRRKFLAVQMTSLADSLRQAQELLLRYQEQERMLNPEMEGGALTNTLFQSENELRTLRFQEGLLATLVATASVEPASLPDLQRVVAMGREVLSGGDALYTRLQQLETERSRLTASRFGYTEQSPQVQVVDSLISATRGQVRVAADQSLSLLRERRRAVEQRIADLRQKIAASPQKSADFAQYQQRVNSIQQAYTPLVGRYYEAQLAEAVQLGDVEVVDPAPTPLNPDPTHRRLQVAIAFFAGLLLSSGGVGLRYQLTTTMQRREDVERITGLPVFGVIPHLTAGAVDSARHHSGIEAFRSLATNLRFASPTYPSVILVTSATPGEGKSTISANLALTSAQQGSRTLLIEADLRRPTMHQVFDFPQSPGIADVLLGDVSLPAALHSVDAYGLDVITGGRQVYNPPSLLGSTAFMHLLEQFRSEYDVIIIDTAPILAVSDASLLFGQASSIVLTVRANRSDRMEVVRSLEQIRRAGGNNIGIVLSDVDLERSSSYYGYYGTDTGSSGSLRPRLRAPRRIGLHSTSST